MWRAVVSGACVALALPMAIELYVHVTWHNKCARRGRPITYAFAMELSTSRGDGFMCMQRVPAWIRQYRLSVRSCLVGNCCAAMSSARVDEIRQRRADINAQIAAVTRAQQDVYNADRRLARQWKLTKRSENIVLITYTLAAYNVDAAVSWLSRHRETKGWQVKSTLDMKRLVEDLFLARDADLLAALTDANAPADASAFREAHKHVMEWQLHNWADAVGDDVGVAVPTDEILDKLREMLIDAPDWIQRQVNSGADGGARKWTSRWRAKWGGVYGTIPQKEQLSTPDLEHKVVGQ